MERVNEEMDGAACVEVFPNSTLYNDDQVLEAMLQGDVQMAAPSLSKFEAFTKQFRIFDLPFMFKNIEAEDAFQVSDTGQAMKESMTRRGLLGLEFWHNGLKQFSANTPLNLPTDAAGLKFRVAAQRRAGRSDGSSGCLTSADGVSRRSTARCKPALSTGRRTRGRISMAASSLKCRTA